MTKPIARPDTETLRKFQLGLLELDAAERVEEWLNETPGAADELSCVPATDRITEALAETECAGALDTSIVPGHSATRPRTAVDLPSDVPVKVGGFHIVRELGRGGMGAVLEGHNDEKNSRVAIKILLGRYATDAGMRNRFLQETTAASRISHPNVVPILRVGEDGGQFYYTMPLLKGETLDDRLKCEKRGKLSAEDVRRIGRDVAAGLAAAHAVGLVHRDLKPSNIWLEADTGRALIFDFGLAKPVDQAVPNHGLTRPGAVMGTPYYMSPEQAKGRDVDSRSDLFSLGSVLYHAATGQRPFKGASEFEVLTAVANATPPSPETLNPELPADLTAVICSLLEKDPANRPRSAADVITELREREVVAPSRVKRHRIVLIAAGLLAAAVLAVTVVVIIRDRNGKVIASIEVPDGGKVEVQEDPSGKPSVPEQKKDALLVFGSKTPRQSKKRDWEPPQVAVVLGPGSDELEPEGGVQNVAFSQNGLQLFCGGKVMRCWDVATGTEVGTRDGRTKDGSFVTPAGDDRVLLAGWHQQVRLWDWKKSKLITEFGHRQGIEEVVLCCPAVLTGKNEAILAHRDGHNGGATVRLWDYETQTYSKEYSHKRYVTTLALEPNGKRFVTGCLDGGTRLWDVAGAKVLAQFPTPSGNVVLAAAWSSNGKYVLTSESLGDWLRPDGDGKKKWCNLTAHVLVDLKQRNVPQTVLAKLDALKDKDRPRDDLQKDLAKVLTDEESKQFRDTILDRAELPTQAVRVWELNGNDPKEIAYFIPTNGVMAVAWSPDCSKFAYVIRDGQLIVRDFPSCQEKYKLKTPAALAPALAFAPDSRHLAVGTRYGTVCVLRLP